MSAEAAFPGANGKIAFTSDRDGNAEIYVMNADGSGQTRLTNNNATDRRPAWSADGQKIAFVSDRDGNPEIYVMNADGSGVTRLTNNSLDDADPTWSPDGQKIAFKRKSPSVLFSDIYVTNSDGSTPTQLTGGNADREPAWAPNGRIAFTREPWDDDAEVFLSPDIYAINADGSGVSPLARSSCTDEGQGNWSPDNQKIAFASFNMCNPEQLGPSAIEVTNADGTGRTFLDFSGFNARPTWSPDGQKIAFDDSDGDEEIYVVSAAGSARTKLTDNAARDDEPDWQPLPSGPIPTADLSISKTDSPDPVFAGQELTYTLTAANDGPSQATGARVVDTLPAGVDFVSASASCTPTGGMLTCGLGSLASGASTEITIVVRPKSTGTITNYAKVQGGQYDPSSQNNSASASTTVRLPNDLSLTLSDSPDPVPVRQPLTYTVAVHNSGPSTATGVTATDLLPRGVSLRSAQPSQGSCHRANRRRLVCPLGDLAADGSASVTIIVRPIRSGSISDIAFVEVGFPGDPDLSNNLDVESTSVLP